MEIHQIKYFVAVAEHLNFTRAAEACNVSQPALTRAIKKLEEEMGGALFRREGRRTHLTELGRVVQPRLQQAISLTYIAKKEACDFSNMVNAQLNLGCMCTIHPQSVIGLVEYLAKTAPDVGLYVHDGTAAELAQSLIEGELDVVIIALPVMPDELQAIPLYTEGYHTAFPENHRFRSMENVPVRELIGERYVSQVNCDFLDMMQETGSDIDVDTDDRFESEHENWVTAMVAAGLGCTVLPDCLVKDSKLHARPLVDPIVTRTVCLVTKRGRKHTPVVDLFIKMCRQLDWK